MKSGRYQILPRVRKVINAKYGVHYKAVWRDPGHLIQYAGQPLRYVHEYIGRGNTIESALRSLRQAYLHEQAEVARVRELTYKEIDKMIEKPPAHCVATSNLPWWRRLFRV